MHHHGRENPESAAGAEKEEMKAAHVFASSDGAFTRKYYAALTERGLMGVIALNLFRAQKCSTRAKKYRRDGSRSAAYDRKRYSMSQLCRILEEGLHQGLCIRYGWKQDPANTFVPWVLYIDLPQGQVSFHSPDRLAGPDYAGEWDRKHASESRILGFCDSVFFAEDIPLWTYETAPAAPRRQKKFVDLEQLVLF